MERCIANGNCIALGFASACGGINGHFAFDGDSGFGLFLFTRNAAAADGCAAGKYFQLIIRIHSFASCAALCGDVGGTGFGALDGNRISRFISGSVIVRFGFCAAADAGCTHTALCVLDGDLSFNVHIAKAARAAADTGTFFTARCFLDLCVAFDGHIAKAKSTAADACATVAALCIVDRCIAINGHSAFAARAAADTGTFFTAGGVSDLSVASNDYIADANETATNTGTTRATFCIFDSSVSFDGHIADRGNEGTITSCALAAADASAVSAIFRIFNDCITSDDDLAVTTGATADAGSSCTALCVFDDGSTFNGHCAQTLKAAADASSHIATRGFGDGTAADGDSAISSNEGARWFRFRAITATNTGTIAARSLCGNIAVGNCDSTIAVGTAANTGTQTAARSGDRTAGNCHIAVTADGVRVTGTAANTGIPITTRGSDLTARNGHLAVVFVTAADASTVVTTRGSQTASSIGRTSLCGAIIILFVLNRQRAAVVGLVMLQTGVAISACQRVVAVQLDVRIAAAGHIHSGLGCRAGVDLHIFQGDIGRLVFVCVDGDRVPRACAGDGDVVVRTIFDVSVAVADVFFLFPIHKPLADALAAFRSVDINGAADNIIRSSKSRKGHAGHHGTGESESCDPLCGNAGRGRSLFLAERYRNMPQDAHGESAIRDH